VLGCPDVAVVDLDLPDRSGLDLLRELREHTCPHPPGAVVLSASGRPEPDDYRLSDRDRYFFKPVRPEQLLAAVEWSYHASRLTDDDPGDRRCRHPQGSPTARP
jgi:CheY-like chemotaxis protein